LSNKKDTLIVLLSGVFFLVVGIILIVQGPSNYENTHFDIEQASGIAIAVVGLFFIGVGLLFEFRKF
jgi:multisubunit Na+/H+ antiporter MnhG subunit